MILLCFALSVISIVGNTYLFIKINSGELYKMQAENELLAGVVSKQNLENTVEFFKKKQARLEELKTTKPSTIEPSI